MFGRTTPTQSTPAVRPLSTLMRTGNERKQSYYYRTTIESAQSERRHLSDDRHPAAAAIHRSAARTKGASGQRRPGNTGPNNVRMAHDREHTSHKWCAHLFGPNVISICEQLQTRKVNKMFHACCCSPFGPSLVIPGHGWHGEHGEHMHACMHDASAHTR